jgi:hypothetical protein
VFGHLDLGCPQTSVPRITPAPPPRAAGGDEYPGLIVAADAAFPSQATAAWADLAPSQPTLAAPAAATIRLSNPDTTAFPSTPGRNTPMPDRSVTPVSFWAAFWRWFGTAVAVAALATAVVLGGWQAGWWFTQQNTTRQAHVVQNSYNTQEGYLTALGNDVSQIDKLVAAEPGAPNAAQIHVEILGIGSQACETALLLTGSVLVPVQVKAWIRANCMAGAVSPGSSLENGSGN